MRSTQATRSSRAAPRPPAAHSSAAIPSAASGVMASTRVAPADPDARPQLLDAYGRVLTPQPLVPSIAPRGKALLPRRSSHVLNRSHSSQELSMSAGGGASGGMGFDDDTASVASYEDGGEGFGVSGFEYESSTPAAAAAAVGVETTSAAADPQLRRRQRAAAARAAASAAAPPLPDIVRESLATLTLRETSTTTLFAMSARRVFAETPEARDTQTSNERYDAAVAMIARAGSDVFPSRGVGAPAVATKSKDVSAIPPPRRTVGLQAASWDLWDALHGKGPYAEVDEEGAGGGGSLLAGGGGGGVGGGDSSPSGTGGGGTSAGLAGGGGGGGGSSSDLALEEVVKAVVSVALATPGCLIDAEGEVAILGSVGPVLPGGVVVGGGGAAPGSRGGQGGLMRAGSTARLAMLGGTNAMASSSASVASGTLNKLPIPSGGSLASSSKSMVNNNNKQGGVGAGGGGWDGFSSVSSADSSFASSVKDGSGGATIAAAGGSGATTASGAAAGATAAAPSAAGGGNSGEPLDVVTMQHWESVRSTKALRDSLALIERAVQQNAYQTSHRAYSCGGPHSDDIDRLRNAGSMPMYGHAAAAAVLAAVQARTTAALVTQGGGTMASSAPPGVGGEEGGEGGHFRVDEGEESARVGFHSVTPHAPPPAISAATSGSGEGGEAAAAAAAAAGGSASPTEGTTNASPRAVPLSPSAAAAAAVAAATSSAVKRAMQDLAAVPTSPCLSRLWSFFAPQLKGLSVSCMAWGKNPGATNFLAVGYGSTDFVAAQTSAGRGLVCLWTLANPTYPALILSTPDNVGVTSIAISSVNHRLLAAGCYDGSICVYDIARIMQSHDAGGDGSSGNAPTTMSERLAPGAHTEPVWQLQWIPRPEEPGGAVLVSTSTDGRVSEWTTRKGTLTPRPLMLLKRLKQQGAGGKGGGGAAAGAAASSSGSGVEGLLSRSAPGLTFEFVYGDSKSMMAAAGAGGLGTSTTARAVGGDDLPEGGTRGGRGSVVSSSGGSSGGGGGSTSHYNTYWVGAEDGTLSRCSVSYRESSLDTVQAHSGPVNRIRLSPFYPAAMLTASSDWTLKLWNAEALPASAASAAAAAASTSSATGGSHTGVAPPLPCLVYTSEAVKDAFVDVVWSPSIATRFAAVTRGGHVQVWDVSQLVPLLDETIHMEADEWAATLAVQRTEKEARALKAAMESVKRIRIDRGDDDDDEAPEPDLVATELLRARQAEGLVPPPVVETQQQQQQQQDEYDAESGKEDDNDEEEDEEEEMGASEGKRGAHGTKRGSKQSASSRAAAAAAAAAAAQAALLLPPPPPVKRLTCVLFSDTNTHVVLTGDASGRVDVYRLVGIQPLGGAGGGGHGNAGMMLGGVEEDDTESSLMALRAALATL